MMFELIFIDRQTGHVNYAITEVTQVHYITPSEVGFSKEGDARSALFTSTENLEVKRIER